MDRHIRGEAGVDESPLEAALRELALGEEAGIEAPSAALAFEEEPAGFAPIDPVVTTDERGRLEVLGGFSPDSMSEVEVEPSAEDRLPGDEALADAIRRELREDAATTDLRIGVAVRRGEAHLRGVVPTLEDADNAEAVAARVPGVLEVVEELDVPGI